jgi:hypothetical protein
MSLHYKGQWQDRQHTADLAYTGQLYLVGDAKLGDLAAAAACGADRLRYRSLGTDSLGHRMRPSPIDEFLDLGYAVVTASSTMSVAP